MGSLLYIGLYWFNMVYITTLIANALQYPHIFRRAHRSIDLMKSTSHRTPSASKWLVGSSNSRRFAWRAATVLNRLPPNPKMMKRTWKQEMMEMVGFFIFGGLRGKNDRKAPYFMVKTPMGFLWIFWGNGSNPHQSAFRATAHAKAKRICHPPLNSNTALPIWSWGQ